MKNKYRKKSFWLFFILIGSVSIVLSVLCFQEVTLNSKNSQEDVIHVDYSRHGFTIPQLAAEGAVMVWTGSMKYNVDCLDISKFGGIYEKQLENTIIQKSDGSYWICGAGVGDKEKVLPNYYEVVDYPMTCTHEFIPYDEMIK